MKIDFSWSLLLILLEVAGTQSLCEFPSTFQGSYMLSKYNSVVNVNVSHIDGLGLIDAPLLEGDIGKQYDCLANNGSKYVIRSVLGDKLPSEAEFRYIFLCMDLTVVSDIKATFVQATKTGPGTKPYDVKFLKLSEVGSDPVSRICDIPESSYLTTMYSVFLKTSNHSSWPRTCPTELLGVYNTQDPSCPASLDACVDNSYIQMDNTSSCTILPLFSANGSVICVHEVRSGNITFLHVYNNDNEVNDTNTFRYTCIALQKEGDTIQLSQNPGDCVANQRPDTATTLGKTTFSFTQPDLTSKWHHTYFVPNCT
ncbi:uncharacterized protein LOC125376202 [Haliotis rufescens]|uniref:uncharacterized protein LOC125376202 n=1 Tax=Haliotis rufescens TaxID=6454 RepID=UPI00201F0718|nr:uncharacterized protein LOC125376202 [Haliotis rufescens]